MPRRARARVRRMYQYDQIDQRLVEERVAQYRDQTRRYLAGTLSVLISAGFIAPVLAVVFGILE